jgi:hypothetical protein
MSNLSFFQGRQARPVFFFADLALSEIPLEDILGAFTGMTAGLVRHAMAMHPVPTPSHQQDNQDYATRHKEQTTSASHAMSPQARSDPLAARLIPGLGACLISRLQEQVMAPKSSAHRQLRPIAWQVQQQDGSQGRDDHTQANQDPGQLGSLFPIHDYLRSSLMMG